MPTLARRHEFCVQVYHVYFSAILIIFYATHAPSVVQAMPTPAQVQGEQYFGQPCNVEPKEDPDGVPELKCNVGHGLACLKETKKCGCAPEEVTIIGSWKPIVPRKWDADYPQFPEPKRGLTRNGKCIWGEFGPCRNDRDCMDGFECQNENRCSKPATKMLDEPCKSDPSEDFCRAGRELWCTNRGTTGGYQCKCKAGKWNRHAVVHNSKYHPHPVSKILGQCQIPEGEKCGKEAISLGPMNVYMVPCWNGTECKILERVGSGCGKKPEPLTTPAPKKPTPKPTKKNTPKSKRKFIDTPCKDNCDHVNGEDRFLFCHHDKCECLPSPKKGGQIPTMWDPNMEVAGLNETGQCVIKDGHDCVEHHLPYSCRSGFLCGEKGKCIPEPTFIDEPCKDTCDHVQGDERFLTCHAKKCHCLPSTKFADKQKKKVKQVLTEWDAKKQVGNMTFRGQCVIQADQDCEGHILPIECKTGFYCGKKGRCEKEPTFINEPCKDTCDHVEGDERFLTCHSGKCHCLPSTKFADKNKKKLVQVPTEWDTLKEIKGSKFKGQCVIKNGKDCTDHLMEYTCKTGYSCGDKGKCEVSVKKQKS